MLAEQRRVLGLDPGTVSFGWALVVGSAAGEHVECPQWGVLTASARWPLAQRLQKLHTGLASLIAEHRPDEVALEEVFTARNPRAALVLGAAHAIALLAAAQAGLPIATYPARAIKETVTGYGNAPKEQVQEMVRRHLGLAERPEPEHAADALAIALCHLWRTSTAQRLSG